ncbi:unnamed protein product [Closterium sp. Yama58-4]|nr:unnamed protein product [Closterium sp. Yama58-4]
MAGVVAHKLLPLVASRITQAAVACGAFRSASSLVLSRNASSERPSKRSQSESQTSGSRSRPIVTSPNNSDTNSIDDSNSSAIATMQAPPASPHQLLIQELAIRPQPRLPLSPTPLIGDPPDALPFQEDAFNPHQRFWLRGANTPPPAVADLPAVSGSAAAAVSPSALSVPCWSVHFKESQQQQMQADPQQLQQPEDGLCAAALTEGQHQPMWPKEWLYQRKPKAFQPRALLVDAMGTLIETSEPEHKVYEAVGQKYGVSLSAEEILPRYRMAYSKPWRGALRYEGEALPFWHHVISESTGCSNPSYAEELHGYYATQSAWRLSDPHAHEAFSAIRQAGIKVAVVSNFDSRLRSVLQSLGCLNCFDAVAVSAEVRAEKPSGKIFHAACDMLNVRPEEVVHVGDSWKNDIGGANAAGCGGALLWKKDVSSFADVAARLGVDVPRSLSRRYYPSSASMQPASFQAAIA